MCRYWIIVTMLHWLIKELIKGFTFSFWNGMEYPSSTIFKVIKMTEIERMLNDNVALRKIYDADPLRHNDDEYHHQIVILV